MKQPNWKDPRNRKRAEKVLDWAAQFVIGKYGSMVPLSLAANRFDKTDENGKLQFSVPGLNDIFGPKGNETGDYLRDLILKPVSTSYKPGEKARTYTIKAEGFTALEAALGREEADLDVSPYAPGAPNPLLAEVSPTPEVSALDRMIKKHAEELHTLTFTYNDSSNRLWHALQNIPRDQKPAFWQKFGLPFDYDIQACAPTILFQLARQAGLPKILLESLQSYLDDRSAFRSHVSALTGLSADDSKRLINSLFNGVKLGNNPRWSAFQLLGKNPERMERFKNDPQVSKLVADIKRVWKRIESERALTMRPTLSEVLEGETRTPWKLKTSRAKWGVYFTHERQVLDAVIEFLTERQIRVFSEHDGFKTNVRVPTDELAAYVKDKTGFEMKIEEKQ